MHYPLGRGLWFAAACAGVWSVLFTAGFAPGEMVVADFTDGNGTAAVDAYVGIPGDGWKTAWGANQLLTAGDTLTATNWVTAANPVAGGGNYLSSSVFTSVTAGASASYATLRNYTDGIDLALPYRIDFTIRIDEDIAATFDEYHDRYVICDGASTATGTATSNSWSILAHGAAGAAAHAGVVGKWAFYNGRNNGNYYGTNPENLLDTGVALTMGGVYDFSVTVDPIARKWSGTVSDGITSFSQSEMGWRTSASLGFANLVFGTRADVGDETRAWSIDSISITQIPEPSTMTLLILAAVVWAACVRERRR